jgi:hypothetical protein
MWKLELEHIHPTCSLMIEVSLAQLIGELISAD